MPCSDSSSYITLQLDSNENFCSFDFIKMTCGRTIDAATGYEEDCRGKTLTEILGIPYEEAARGLKASDEEERFILYLEWDALRSAIVQYLGVDDESIDGERCHVASVDHHPDGVNVSLVILPPRDMPKIQPCCRNDTDDVE